VEQQINLLASSNPNLLLADNDSSPQASQRMFFTISHPSMTNHQQIT